MRSEDLCWGCSGGQGNDHLHHRSEVLPKIKHQMSNVAGYY